MCRSAVLACVQLQRFRVYLTTVELCIAFMMLCLNTCLTCCLLQMAVAVYFLDRLALRAGHEKDEDEADTVGCCTLKVRIVATAAACSSCSEQWTTHIKSPSKAQSSCTPTAAHKGSAASCACPDVECMQYLLIWRRVRPHNTCRLCLILFRTCSCVCDTSHLAAG